MIRPRSRATRCRCSRCCSTVWHHATLRDDCLPPRVYRARCGLETVAVVDDPRRSITLSVDRDLRSQPLECSVRVEAVAFTHAPDLDVARRVDEQHPFEQRLSRI